MGRRQSVYQARIFKSRVGKEYGWDGLKNQHSAFDVLKKGLEKMKIDLIFARMIDDLAKRGCKIESVKRDCYRADWWLDCLNLGSGWEERGFVYKEEWRAVAEPGWQEIYEVSSFGRVRSVDRTVPYKLGQGTKHLKGRLLKLGLAPTGYRTVTFSKNGYHKYFTVHKLVVDAFKGSHAGLEINHKDENKKNNFIGNLELITHKQNCNYGTVKERRKATQVRKGYTKPILITDTKTGEKKLFSATAAAARALKVTRLTLEKHRFSKKPIKSRYLVELA